MADSRVYYVYILASLSRTLYVGITNDLPRRILEHRRGECPGFTRTYRVHRLVCFECTSDVNAAVAREKQLKRWPRWRKERLIEGGNAEWVDLSIDWAPAEERPRPGR